MLQWSNHFCDFVVNESFSHDVCWIDHFFPPKILFSNISFATKAIVQLPQEVSWIIF